MPFDESWGGFFIIARADWVTSPNVELDGEPRSQRRVWEMRVSSKDALQTAEKSKEFAVAGAKVYA
jgi:hypothetical protein